MEDTTPRGNSLRFATFELDVRSRELRSGSNRVRLQDQPFEILRLMLERPGDVITREELQHRLWPKGTYVDFEHSLNAAVKRLRTALGDDADRPRFVETLPRRGYRFIAPLQASHARTAADAVSTAHPRLAVLPFSNLSDDRSHEYFSDGLTDELIAQLGPRCRGRISVIARRSSSIFKGTGQRAREIADTLNADYLLEGSVRSDGRRVRIIVRLVEGRTETDLWSDTHDRTVENWLSVQADVAAHVARSLMVELVPTPTVDAPDPLAHQAYLKARYHWERPADDGYDEALLHLQAAIRQAPEYAPALGLLARVLVGGAEYHRTLPRTALAAAREAAERALAVDPSNGEALVVLADVSRMAEFDWDAAHEGYRAALAANPSSEFAHRGHAVLLAIQQRHDEAIRAGERAREIDPLCLVPGTVAAWTRYVAGDHDQVLVDCRHTLDMGTTFLPAWRLLAASQLELGRTREAVATLEEARRRAGDKPQLLAWLAHAYGVAGRRPDALRLVERLRAGGSTYLSQYHLAVAHVGLGDADSAFDCLTQAYTDRDPMIASLALEPRLASLRDDPRYGELLELMNLA